MGRVSPNMGLRIWDNPADPYNSEQLAQNWAKVDQHDHSPGKGNRIGSEGIANGSITAEKLAPGAIGIATVADNTITSAKIVDGTVTGSDIASGTITSANIQDGSIQTGDLQDGAITSLKISNSTIQTTDIGDSQITTDKIANATILGTDIASETITSSNIQNATLTPTDFATLTNQQLGLSDGSVRNAYLGIATSQNSTSTSYGYLSTADRITNVVVPSEALLEIVYKAEWQCTDASQGRAAIFIGSNQLKIPDNSSPVVQEASQGSSTSVWQVLTTVAGKGLKSDNQSGSYSGDVSTGMIVGTVSQGGGPVKIYVPAGTYDIGVQYKVQTSGTLSIRDRKLWVRVRKYGSTP